MINDTFLDLYRRFEASVRNKYNCSVKEYEDTLQDTPDKQDKIRMIRMIRNYLSHNDMKFVEASPEMISLLQKELILLDDGEVPVSKKMFSVKSSPIETSLLTTTCDWLSKKKLTMCPVFNEKDFAVGVVSQNDIIRFVASGNFNKTKKTSVVVSKYKFKFLSDSTPMKNVIPLIEQHNQIYLILNKSNNVIGWIV